MSRRSFVASSVALPFALRSMAHATPVSTASPRWVLLGTDKGPGISRCSWDSATGKLGAAELVVKSPRADFLAMHPRLPRLYAGNALGGGKGAVSSFHLDRTFGSLTFADAQSSMGDGPCFVSVEPRGQLAFVANYSGGSFTAYRLASDGALLPPVSALDCHQNSACGTVGPNKDRQDASHLHCANVSPDGNFVLACDLGMDSIEVFAIHPEALTPVTPAIEKPFRVEARPGSGPRHLAFHPNARWIYVVHELDCTLELYDWTVARGKAHLSRRDGTAVSTLAVGARPDGDTGCEVLVGAKGRFVYACTRGAKSNTVSVYAVDHKTGHLKQQQIISCGGEVPRHIAFDPNGRWLLCSNQGNSTVTVFAHDAATGKLSGPVQSIAADTPMFAQFV